MPSSANSLFLLAYAALLLWGCGLFWKLKCVRPSARMFLRIGLGSLLYFTALKVLFLTPALSYIPHLIGTGAWFWVVIGPLFYLTTQVLVDPEAALRPVDGLHLFPLIGMLPQLLPFYVLPSDAKLELFYADLQNISAPSLQSLFFGLIFFAYLGVTWRTVHRVSMDTDAFTHWRRRLLYGALLLMFCVILADAVVGYLTVSAAFKYHVFTLLTLLAFFAIVAATLGLHPEPTLIPASVRPLPQLPLASAPRTAKYQNTPTDAAQLQALRTRLHHAMQEAKLYRRGSLQRRDVADHLDISVHRLSQLLSQELGTSFYDYINGFRIEEAVRFLQDPHYAHLTLLAISLEVGFNSKSTFNRTFKKQMGMTPSAYRKAHMLSATLASPSS